MAEGADVDRLLAELARWTADQRAEEAVQGRTRRRWLQQQASEEAHLAGVALDLAERGVPVAVRTRAGRTVRGVIAAVARDFWVIDGTGSTTMLATRAVTTVRPQPGAGAGEATGGRTDVLPMAFADALVMLAGDRPRVRLALDGDADPVSGELRAAGTDVLTVRLDGEPPAMVYVAFSGVIECSILGSG